VKKSNIFFLCYYAVFIVGTALAAFLLFDHLAFNAWSVAPIACFVLSLFLVWFCESGRAQTLSDKHELHDAAWNMGRDYTPSKYEEPMFHHIAVSYLVIAPFFLPLIPFFSGESKAILSIVLFLLGCFSYLVYHICGYLAKEDKEKRMKEDQLKKEQQEREELGKWK
jgi:hypothetical protein